jgi:hypothetical protein
VATGRSWIAEMLSHGGRVLSDADDLLQVLPTNDIRDVVSF